MFKTFQLRTLFVMASLVIVLLILSVVLSIQVKLNQIMSANQSSDMATKAVELSLDSKYHIVQIQQFLTDASLTGDLDGIKDAKEHLLSLKKTVDEIGTIKPEFKTLADEVYSGSEELAKTGLEMVKAYLEKGKEAGNEIMKRPKTGLDANSEELEKKTNELVTGLGKDKEEADLKLKSSEESMRAWVSMISLIAILTVIFAQLLIYRRISPISAIILGIQNQAKNVHKVSVVIKQTTNELSTASTEQAAAIQETVASSEEMASMLSQTTQHSTRSLQVSEEGKDKSENALRVMQRLNIAMEDIQQTNSKLESLVRLIEEIKSKTKVINDIVFETRLLSFNASIEAARAGTHGKGFAVVAEEVGKLATMSGRAADEIRTLLDSSTNEVSLIVRGTQEKVVVGKNVSEECNSVFQEMGVTLNKIIESVNKISSATKEQEIGIKQTNRAMSELDQVSNSNSRTSSELLNQTEKLFDASNELDVTIIDLQRLVFGLDFDETHLAGNNLNDNLNKTQIKNSNGKKDLNVKKSENSDKKAIFNSNKKNEPKKDLKRASGSKAKDSEESEQANHAPKLEKEISRSQFSGEASGDTEGIEKPSRSGFKWKKSS